MCAEKDGLSDFQSCSQLEGGHHGGGEFSDTGDIQAQLDGCS